MRPAVFDAANYIEDLHESWTEDRLKSFLGRWIHTEDDWCPNWPTIDEAVSSRRRSPSPRSVQSRTPSATVTWEDRRPFPASLRSAIGTARFRSFCGGGLPQHLHYVVDNKFYLFNILSISGGTYGKAPVDDPKPFIVSKATINAIAFFQPPTGALSQQQLYTAFALATPTFISFYGLQKTVEQYPTASPTAFVHLRSQVSDTLETVPLCLVSFPELEVNTGGRSVRDLISDDNGRLYVSFWGDGCGLYEIVCSGSGRFSFFRSSVSLTRIIKSSGEPISRSSIPSAFANLVFETVTRLGAHQPAGPSIIAIQALGRLIVTAATDQTLRIYKASFSYTQEKVNGKKRKLQTPPRYEDESMDVVGVTDERALTGFSNSTKTLSKGVVSALHETLTSPIKRKLNDGTVVVSQRASPQIQSQPRQLQLAATVSLELLAKEVCRSEVYDPRILSTQGLGEISAISLVPTRSSELYLLSLITSTSRRVDIGIQLTDEKRTSQCKPGSWDSDHTGASLSLLSFQAVSFPSLHGPSLSSGFIAASILDPALAAPPFPLESTRVWQDGPLFLCATTRLLKRPFALTDNDGPPFERPSPEVHMITIGFHPCASPPFSLGNMDYGDGYASVETDEPALMVVPVSTLVLDYEDFLHESRRALPAGSDLMTIAVEETMHGSMIPFVGHQQPDGYSLMRSFLVFFKTHVRRLQIRWSALTSVDAATSLTFELISGMGGQKSAISSILHPDYSEGRYSHSRYHDGRHPKLGAQVRPCPSVYALSKILIELLWDPLRAPLFLSNDPLPIVSWRRLDKMYVMLNALVSILKSPQNLESLTPAALSRTSPILPGDGIDSSQPLHGVGVLEEILAREPDQFILFLNQRRLLIGLATFVNLMCQIAQLLQTLIFVSENHQPICFETEDERLTCQNDLWDIIQAAAGIERASSIEKLFTDPLIKILSSEDLLPISTLCHTLVELLAHAAGRGTHAKNRFTGLESLALEEFPREAESHNPTVVELAVRDSHPCTPVRYRDTQDEFPALRMRADSARKALNELTQRCGFLIPQTSLIVHLKQIGPAVKRLHQADRVAYLIEQLEMLIESTEPVWVSSLRDKRTLAEETFSCLLHDGDYSSAIEILIRLSDTYEDDRRNYEFTFCDCLRETLERTLLGGVTGATESSDPSSPGSSTSGSSPSVAMVSFPMSPTNRPSESLLEVLAQNIIMILEKIECGSNSRQEDDDAVLHDLARLTVSRDIQRKPLASMIIRTVSNVLARPLDTVRDSAGQLPIASASIKLAESLLEQTSTGAERLCLKAPAFSLIYLLLSGGEGESWEWPPRASFAQLLWEDLNKNDSRHHWLALTAFMHLFIHKERYDLAGQLMGAQLINLARTDAASIHWVQRIMSQCLIMTANAGNFDPMIAQLMRRMASSDPVVPLRFLRNDWSCASRIYKEVLLPLLACLDVVSRKLLAEGLWDEAKPQFVGAKDCEEWGVHWKGDEYVVPPIGAKTDGFEGKNALNAISRAVKLANRHTHEGTPSRKLSIDKTPPRRKLSEENTPPTGRGTSLRDSYSLREALRQAYYYIETFGLFFDYAKLMRISNEAGIELFSIILHVLAWKPPMDQYKNSSEDRAEEAVEVSLSQASVALQQCLLDAPHGLVGAAGFEFAGELLHFAGISNTAASGEVTDWFKILLVNALKPLADDAHLRDAVRDPRSASSYTIWPVVQAYVARWYVQSYYDVKKEGGLWVVQALREAGVLGEEEELPALAEMSEEANLSEDDQWKLERQRDCKASCLARTHWVLGDAGPQLLADAWQYVMTGKNSTDLIIASEG